MSLSTYYLVYGSHLARLHRRRRRTYAPTSNTANHYTMRKSTRGFPFVSHMSIGLRLAALRAAGAPLLKNQLSPVNVFKITEKCLKPSLNNRHITKLTLHTS